MAWEKAVELVVAGGMIDCGEGKSFAADGANWVVLAAIGAWLPFNRDNFGNWFRVTRLPKISSMPEGIQRCPRTKMVLPLRVWTHEGDGEALPTQLAHTVEISHLGCRLGGLRTELSPGQTITLQRGQQKAAFRVIWSRQLAANENQAGIEALDYGKDIWAVELPPPSFVPRKPEAVATRPADRKSILVSGHPRLRWSFGLLVVGLVLGMSVFCLMFYGSSGMALRPPVPAVPTARELARLAPKPRLAPSSLTRTWDSSAPHLQVAEVPTGHIVYPVAPDSGIRGTVQLQILIAANGLVKQIHALSGPQTLAEAAAEAVRLWHYSSFPGSTHAERETSVTVSFLGPDAVFLQFPSSNAQASAEPGKAE